eukprot:CAMPEP_0197235018 /NCGR_PEP_ID=MMETSP1429-20130617/2571_2 /TAXON_ID=49237 /ORGANISM="Chaetoceros  sp., Strain UNC1202" /LENGTH=97 /DNA_ID=CAMNT_0042693527 /DNA_START=483 /DNA_END=776 /DNA_ORIENTATION=-
MFTFTSSAAIARPGTANTLVSMEKATDRRVTKGAVAAFTVGVDVVIGVDLPVAAVDDGEEEEFTRARALHVHGISNASGIDIVSFIRSDREGKERRG